MWRRPLLLMEAEKKATWLPRQKGRTALTISNHSTLVGGYCFLEPVIWNPSFDTRFSKYI